MKNPSVKKLATRQKILDAALVSFAQYGYQGASIPVIAQEAGLAVGSIYVHFADKRALVNELYRYWKGEILQRLRKIPADIDFPRAFSQVWEVFVEFARVQPQAFLFLESHFHAPYLDVQSLAFEEEVFALAAQLIDAGKRAGYVKDIDANVLSGVFFGAIVQLFKQGEAKSWNPRGLEQAKALLWEAFKK